MQLVGRPRETMVQRQSPSCMLSPCSLHGPLCASWGPLLRHYGGPKQLQPWTGAGSCR